jgi:glutaredoxin
VTVEIYSKADCCLCDEAKKVLLAAQRKVPFEIREVDIEGDAALLERFRYDIPVIFVDGKKAFKHRVSEATLLARIARASRP